MSGFVVLMGTIAVVCGSLQLWLQPMEACARWQTISSTMVMAAVLAAEFYKGWKNRKPSSDAT
jgi:hypothetical protein